MRIEHICSILLTVWIVRYSPYVKGACQDPSTVVISTSPAQYFRLNRCVTYEPIEYSAASRDASFIEETKQIEANEGSGTLQDLVNSIREDWK